MNASTTDTAKMSPEVLNSWKEIANYLGRGVRTVQRWEAELHLPVRRPGGKGRSAVIAMRSEIDGWLKACPLEARQALTEADDSSNATQPVMSPTRELLVTSRQLRDDMVRARHQVRDAIHELVASLEKVVGTSRSNHVFVAPYPSTQKSLTTAANGTTAA